MFNRHKPAVYREPRPTAWLWKTAVVLTLVAAGFVYLLRKQLPDPDVEPRIRAVVAIASLAVGLCVISAMASRWVRR